VPIHKEEVMSGCIADVSELSGQQIGCLYEVSLAALHHPHAFGECCLMISDIIVERGGIDAGTQQYILKGDVTAVGKAPVHFECTFSGFANLEKGYETSIRLIADGNKVVVGSIKRKESPVGCPYIVTT
jgi:hypothetical protein